MVGQEARAVVDTMADDEEGIVALAKAILT
jgi:hypothetical protein